MILVLFPATILSLALALQWLLLLPLYPLPPLPQEKPS